MENKETISQILADGERLKESIEHEHIKNLIDDVMCANFCEDNTQQYVKYLKKDLDLIEILYYNDAIDEIEMNHLLEDLKLLKDIIKTIYKGEIR